MYIYYYSMCLLADSLPHYHTPGLLRTNGDMEAYTVAMGTMGDQQEAPLVQAEVVVQVLVEFWLNQNNYNGRQGDILAQAQVSYMYMYMYVQCTVCTVNVHARPYMYRVRNYVRPSAIFRTLYYMMHMYMFIRTAYMYHIHNSPCTMYKYVHCTRKLRQAYNTHYLMVESIYTCTCTCTLLCIRVHVHAM